MSPYEGEHDPIDEDIWVIQDSVTEGGVPHSWEEQFALLDEDEQRQIDYMIAEGMGSSRNAFLRQSAIGLLMWRFAHPEVTTTYQEWYESQSNS
jgi:hypothetical protein